MLWLLLFTVLSLAAEDPNVNLDETLDDLGMLQPAVDLVRRIDTPFEVTEGPLVLRFESGWVVPVFAGKQPVAGPGARRDLARERLSMQAQGLTAALVGFAWVGEGSATLHFARPGEAMRFANTQVLGFGGEPEVFAPIAQRLQPYVTTTQQGFVIGRDDLFDVIWPGGPPDPNEVFVYTQSAEARRAADRAATTLMRRVRVYDRYFGDFQREFGWRRLAAKMGGGDHTVFTDVQTDTRFGVVDPPGTNPTPGDRWLGTMSASVDSTYVQIVQSLGVLHDQSGLGGLVLTGGLRPTLDADDVTAPPARPTALMPGKAHVDLYVQRDVGGGELIVEARSTLDITAQGGDIAWVDLDLADLRRTSNQFEITRLTDGQDRKLAHSTRPSFDTIRPLGGIADRVADVTTRQASLPTAQTPGGNVENQLGEDPTAGINSAIAGSFAGDLMEEDPIEQSDVRRRGTFRVVLPQPLQEGQSTQIQLWWSDRWAMRQGETCINLGTGFNDDQPLRASGVGTGLRPLFPAMPGVPQNASFDITARLHLPKEDRLQVVLPGVVASEGEEADWRFEHHVVGNARDARVAFGRWNTVEKPAKEPFPAFTVNMQKNNDRALRGTPVELRKVLSYFGGVMPAYPFDTIRVVQAPPRCEASLQWPTSHETIELYQAVVPDALPVTLGPFSMQNRVSPRDREPMMESHRLAAAVARGWWFHDAAPASAEDEWLNHALTWGMACMYVGAAYGPAACDIRLNGSRKLAERAEGRAIARPLTLPDNGARFRRESLGPYILFHMLRLRLGNAAFFDALRMMLNEHPGESITTDRLRAYFERTSGRPLGDFFDYWVEGGIVPKMTMDWTPGEYGAVSGVIRSDVPYGRLDVPVMIRRQGGIEEVVWVDVVDGEGSFSVGAGEPVRKVELDPDDLTLARGGKVRKMK